MADLAFLAKTILFQDTSQEEIASMLHCLGAIEKQYKKNEIIFHSGDFVSSMGLILSGSVQIENDDLWGNRSVLDHIGKGRVFAETYAFLPKEPLQVTVTAPEKVSVLFLRTDHLLHTCSNACPHHQKLIENLLKISAQKNLNLSRRIFHTSPKTIRGRLLSYLSFQAASCGKPEFDIPFNRQQLADYLNVDRSALSNELGKMQKEDLLQVTKNHFVLKCEV